MRSIFRVELVKEKPLRSLEYHLVIAPKTLLRHKLNVSAVSAHCLRSVIKNIVAFQHLAVLLCLAQVSGELPEPQRKIVAAKLPEPAVQVGSAHAQYISEIQRKSHRADCRLVYAHAAGAVTGTAAARFKQHIQKNVNDAGAAALLRSIDIREPAARFHEALGFRGKLVEIGHKAVRPVCISSAE